jgi:hypothetical protein
LSHCGIERFFPQKERGFLCAIVFWFARAAVCGIFPIFYRSTEEIA